MKTIQEQLVDRLHDRATTADLQFSADDVSAAAAEVTPIASRGSHQRSQFLAVAAAIVVLGGFATYVANRSTTAQLESGPATEVVQSDAAEETARAVEELTIRPTGGVPERLDAGGVVLDADQVGVIEVGPPSEMLLEEQPWLAGGRCVATATGFACAAAEYVVAGSPPEEGRNIFSFHSGFGYHMAMAPPASNPDGPFMFLEQNAAAIVSGLPVTAVTVEIDLGEGEEGPFLQRPNAGTAAFPLSPSVSTIRVRAHDDQGRLVWDSLVFDLPQDQPGEEPADFGLTDVDPDIEGVVWTSLWVLVETGFDREVFDLAPGTQVVATIDNGLLSIDTGCTKKTGLIRFGNAGAAVITDIQQLTTGCDAAHQEQDQLINDLLIEGPTIIVEDRVMTWTGRKLIIEFITDPTQTTD